MRTPQRPCSFSLQTHRRDLHLHHRHQPAVTRPFTCCSLVHQASSNHQVGFTPPWGFILLRLQLLQIQIFGAPPISTTHPNCLGSSMKGCPYLYHLLYNS
uniref:Uncharacterized protein n=1 Tax=Opuntia streptacantha TaxID=393608 RepID=A0A7C9F2F0_OPUST